jgi:Xaa-Pro aminopeptidase
MTTLPIPAIQAALAEADLDAWFFLCFQTNDPIALDLLGLGGERLVTRRCYYLIPRHGEPLKLVHGLEPAMLDHLPGAKTIYTTWRQNREGVQRLVQGQERLAAQYSPGNVLPSVSRLDAGTAELLREAGCTIVSSADLAQRFAAVWSEEQLESHRRANVHLHRLVKEAFTLVGDHLRARRPIDEWTVARFLLDNYEREGLWADHAPIVGVNAHSADPHYQPSAEASAPIRAGDFLLIDHFAKEKRPGSVFADITWCAVCAPAPEPRHEEVWRVVSGARDAAWETIRSRYPRQTVRGFEVDDAARAVIEAAGYGAHFIHRTGHSIGVSIHGQGANMDNLETHDTRPLIPITGFSIEPGVYLEGDFGVRSEINVAITPSHAEITGGEPQRELVRILA